MNEPKRSASISSISDSGDDRSITDGNEPKRRSSLRRMSRVMSSRRYSNTSTASKDSVPDPLLLASFNGEIGMLMHALDQNPSIINKPFDFSSKNLLTAEEESDSSYMPPAAVPVRVRAALAVKNPALMTKDQRWVIVKGFSQSTLLHYACAGDQYDIVSMLLKRGADKSITNVSNRHADYYTMDDRIQGLLWGAVIPVASKPLPPPPPPPPTRSQAGVAAPPAPPPPPQPPTHAAQNLAPLAKSFLLNPDYEKYIKMKRMLPEGAVRLKMKQEGFSEQEIDAFMSADLSPAPPAPTPPPTPPVPPVRPSAPPAPPAPPPVVRHHHPAPPPPPATAGSSSTFLSDPQYEKYIKMKRMLPEGAVRLKMKQEGFSEQEIDAFMSADLSPAPPAPAPIPPPTPPAPLAPSTPSVAPPPALHHHPTLPISSQAASSISSPAHQSSWASAFLSDPQYEKYIKMKRMLPEGAVRLKMKQEGFSEQEIDAFMSADLSMTSAPPPTPSAVPAPPPTPPVPPVRPSAPPAPPAPPPVVRHHHPAPPPPPATSGSSSTFLSDPQYEKYIKMKRMLPEGAVRLKMKQEGFSEQEIDAFMSADLTSAHLGPSTIDVAPTPVISAPLPPPVTLIAPPAHQVDSNLDRTSNPHSAPVDTKYEKYLKMQRLLPEVALRLKMKQDGFTETEIETFINGPSATNSCSIPTQAKGSSHGQQPLEETRESNPTESTTMNHRPSFSRRGSEAERRPSLFAKLMQAKQSTQSQSKDAVPSSATAVPISAPAPSAPSSSATSNATESSTNKRSSFKRALQHRKHSAHADDSSKVSDAATQSAPIKAPKSATFSPVKGLVKQPIKEKVKEVPIGESKMIDPAEEDLKAMINLYAEYEDEAWESRAKKDGPLTAKLWDEVITPEEKTRRRQTYIENSGRAEQMKIGRRESVSQFIGSLAPLKVATCDDSNSWIEAVDESQLEAMEAVLAPEVKDSMTTGSIASDGGSDSMNNMSADEKTAMMMLAQLKEGKKPLTNRELLWRRAAQQTYSRSQGDVVSGDKAAEVMKMIAYRKGRLLMEKEFKQYSRIDLWEGLQVSLKEEVAPPPPEEVKSWRQLLGRRRSELMVDHYRSLKERAKSTPPDSRRSSRSSL